MKNLKTLLTCVTLLVAMASGFAQNPMAAEVTSEKEKGYLKQFVQEKNGSPYVVSNKGKDYYLKKFDGHTLELQQEWEIERFKYSKETTLLDWVSATDQGIHLVYRAYNVSKKTVYFVERLISYEGNLGEVREIAVATGVVDYRKIDFIFSDDKSRIAIITPPDKDVAPKAFVFDSDLNMLWEQSYGNPFKDGPLTITQTEVTNDGDLLVVGYRDDGKFRDYEIKTSTKYGVIKIDTEKRISVYDLSGLEKTFHGLSIKPDLRSGYILAGFYSEEEKGYANGVYYAELDTKTMRPAIEQLQNTNDHSSDLDQSFDIFHAAMGGHKKDGFASFRCKDFAKFENGNIAVVAERDYVSNIPGVYRNRFVGEVVILGFNEKGQFIWLNTIPKKQTDNGLGSVSYIFHHAGDRMFLLYNDDVRNAESINNGEGNQYSGFGRNYGLIGARIDQKGNMKLSSLPSVESYKLIVSTKRYFSLNAENLYVYRLQYGMGKFKISKYNFDLRF